MVAHRVLERGGGRGRDGLADARHFRPSPKLEHARRDVVALREKGHPLHHIVELPHIAGPRVAQDPLFGIGGEPLGRQSVFRAGLIEEAPGEQNDVPTALAERGQAQGEHGQAVIEVLPEGALTHRRLQIRVGGADHPHIRGLRFRRTQSAHHALLQHLEELGLGRLSELSDLVEKDHAPMRSLEEAGLGAAGIGEGSALVAEQLGLDKMLGHRGAVEIHEGRPRARARSMEHAGDQPFATARLALEQHGG